MPPNPFRTHGIVQGEYFTDRSEEVRRIREALRSPASKLLVYGYRRMGKSSALARAAGQVARRGGSVFTADLSTASTVADMANRILQSVTRMLGRRWKDAAADFVSRLQATVTLTPNPATGLVVPTLAVGLRRADLDDQRATLGRVLDAVNELAGRRGKPVGIILDEFQEIVKFGGEDAEWHLRGVMQHHQHVSYVLAGSRPHLIRRMLEPGRAFYDMLDVLHFGPMEPGGFAHWIERRMRGAGLPVEPGLGARIVTLAGPRTRDVVLLARATADRAGAGAGEAGGAARADAELAFADVVAERDDAYRDFWEALTPHQQNVLRAIAAAAPGLTTAATLERFALSSSSAVSQTLAAFVDDGRLVKTDAPPGYAFDSPFLRGWVVTHALPDLGLLLPPTHRPGGA